jgi:hypothetical protein
MRTIRTSITVNGQEYSSIDQMPPEVRQEYERAMSFLADHHGDGIPDLLEHARKANVGAATSTPAIADKSKSFSTVIQSTRYVVNGRQYDRLEDVPAHLQKAIVRSEQPLLDTMPTAIPAGQPSGYTFRFTWAGPQLSWSKILALVAAATVTALVVWMFH